MTKIVGYVSVAIIIILLAVSIFLITNTIILGITVRKEEITIMSEPQTDSLKHLSSLKVLQLV